MYNYYTCKHISLCLRISINYEDFDETFTCLIANRIQKKKNSVNSHFNWMMDGLLFQSDIFDRRN